MKYDFILFGGTGQQGKICAKDLLESGYRVLLAGRNKETIKDLLKNKKAGFLQVDLRNFEDIVKAIKYSKAEVVVNCAELVFNVPIMKACLKTGKSLTDLGGLQTVTSEQFKLHEEFERKGIACITGCGSTPGILNVLVRHAVEHFDSIDTIYLGFAWDSNIKRFVVPYSMHSIFDEFTEKPVTFHNGRFVKENRMICKGRMKFREVGEQTVYCIVHSEVFTFSKYFKNKKLKNIHYMAGFPEHSMKVIQTLIDAGFSSDGEIDVNGKKVKIVNFTDKVLSKIKSPKGYEEVEDLWAKIYGMKDGRKKEMNLDCVVKTIKGWEFAGSNVDTGRTISIMSQMLFNGLILEKGVFAPEAVIPVKPFFKELSKRRMFVYENGKKIN